jgi:hypothetical protein
MEAARGGWDIRIVNQPPNSPDCNILDLGWFASIQSMFHRKMPKTLPEIVQKVPLLHFAVLVMQLLNFFPQRAKPFIFSFFPQVNETLLSIHIVSLIESG